MRNIVLEASFSGTSDRRCQLHLKRKFGASNGGGDLVDRETRGFLFVTVPRCKYPNTPDQFPFGLKVPQSTEPTLYGIITG